MRDGHLLLTAVAVLGLGAVLSVHRSSQDIAPGTPASAVSSSEGSATAAPSGGWVPRTLTPVPNPDPEAPAQPARVRPYRVITSADGHKAYVTLSGKEISPGNEVVVLDVAGQAELTRVAVGSYPHGLALHPSGRWVVVTHRYSNWLGVVDVATDRLVSRIPVPFYCDDIVLSPDGTRAFLSSFALDQVVVVDLTDRGAGLEGQVKDLGPNRRAFFGKELEPAPGHASSWLVCAACGWRDHDVTTCPRCGHGSLRAETPKPPLAREQGVQAALRARCGTAGCHLYRAGGFVAGHDDQANLTSALAHIVPGDPSGSPLMRVATGTAHGGRADAVDGAHHPGGVVFANPDLDPDYATLAAWIRDTRGPGPGIPVGAMPRDLVVSPDGLTLYVANTGSLDVSVVDLTSLREQRRIFTRSPVNDLAWVDGRLVLATLGVGSGHPGAHHAGRESTDREHPDAEFTLFRDLATGKPLPLNEQQPLGPYAAVDGTANEKFRDITNDVVLLDPAVDSVAAYRATERFTRYTSDSFEALPGDKKGDVPHELMKVAGAFPEQLALAGDQLYVTMSGTFEVQAWTIDLAAPPARRLRPGRVYSTGLKPTGIAVADDTLIVADHLAESVSFIDLQTGERTALSLSGLAEPFPANDFERGELFVQTSVFSVDQDQSCVHCHYRDASDGKAWSVSQVMGQSRDGEERTGGSREVPDLRGLFHDVPFFLEGILSMDEPLTMMMEHNPLIDFQGPTPAGDFDDIFATDAEAAEASSADGVVVATSRRLDVEGVRLADLLERREVHVARVSKAYFGETATFRDLQRFIGTWQGGEPRLLASPIDPDDSVVDDMLRRGRALFDSPEVGCSRCHAGPGFTDKVHIHNDNRALPPLVTPAPRDNVHTLISADRIDRLNGYTRSWDPDDPGRVEAREGFIVVPSLRGLFARPPRFLHHGMALSLREVICPPRHIALRTVPYERVQDQQRADRAEVGRNELHGLPDLHGTTSHLSVWDVECLVTFLRSIQ